MLQKLSIFKPDTFLLILYLCILKTKTLETKNILIHKKNYMDLLIYFTRYDGRKSIRILTLYYNKLMGTIEEHERKNTWYLNSALNKALDKIKEIIGIQKSDDTKILIDTDDKLPDYISLKNVLIIVTSVIKNGDKLYPQLFLEETLYNE